MSGSHPSRTRFLLPGATAVCAMALLAVGCSSDSSSSGSSTGTPGSSGAPAAVAASTGGDVLQSDYQNAVKNVLPSVVQITTTSDLGSGVVYDDKLLEYLLGIDAQKWFSERAQMLRDHPDEKAFVSSYWELVPGQTPLIKKISFGTGARGAVVFANYFSEGKHRARLDPHKDVVIHLRDTDFCVEPACLEPAK